MSQAKDCTVFRPARLSQSFEIATGRLFSKIPPPTRQCRLEVRTVAQDTWSGMRTVAQLRREQHEAIPVNKDSLYARAFAVCATAHFPHARALRSKCPAPANVFEATPARPCLAPALRR